METLFKQQFFTIFVQNILHYFFIGTYAGEINQPIENSDFRQNVC